MNKLIIIYYQFKERKMNMSKVNYCEPKNADKSVDNAPVDVTVNVTVNVTKIVKYLCFAGIVIVGIIFGTRCYQKMIEDGII
jgi:hypothetical protein